MLKTVSLTPAQRMGLSIAVATGLYGLSFGALSVAAGLSVVQTLALSLLMFTGGSQFAFIGVIGGGGSGGMALTAASLLGIRNAVYAVQVNRLLSPRHWLRKPLTSNRGGSGLPVWASMCCGAASPCWVPGWATFWAIHATGGWMVRR